MSSYLKRYKPIKQMILKQMKYNREQNQWDIKTNSNSIVGASVPLKQAQDHNMLCQFVINTNEFISTIKLCAEFEENLLVPLVEEAGHNLI